MSSTPDRPSDSPASLLDKSATLLGWPLIQNALSGKTCSPVSAARCRTLQPETDFRSAEEALQETGEMTALLEAGDSLPLRSFDDLHPILDDCRQKRILDPHQCLSVLNLLRLGRAVKRVLEKHPQASRLQNRGRRLEPLTPLLRDLERCLDEEGEIRDNASPELRQALRDVGTAKEKLESRVKKLFGTAGFKDALQETYATEREGRLVLPIRSEYRSRVEGIIHDSSASGQTVFLEPTTIIPLNNQLKLSRLQVEHEKQKILQSLARQIGDHAEPLRANLNILVELDLVHARAQLGRALKATRCPLNREGRVKLLQARNPELILNGAEVVPNDLVWDASVRVILISGPNTGGKTVTLKTLGLMSLMARAGLFLPVAEGSAIPFFPGVYADIGDEQNIQLNLSTFSAHLQKIIHILDHAPPGALILLDELGIATDPGEGAALAEAVLKNLQSREVTTLVSTHYPSLKILAQTEPGFLNACTEFDDRTLRPTYRLLFGVPGFSAALDTAERLGLPPSIIQQARDVYKTRENPLENLLQDLTRQKRELQGEHDLLKQQRQTLEQLKAEQRQRTESLRQEEQEFRKNKTRRLQRTVREARHQIRRMMNDLKGTRDRSKIRRTEKQIQALGRAPRVDPSQDLSEWDVPSTHLKKGDDVWVETLGTPGLLLDDPAGKKRVRVKLGNVLSWVEGAKLKGRSHKSRSRKRPSPPPPRVTVQTETAARAQTTCDLRGLPGDEALTAVEAFVSQAIAHRLPHARIIHGHGMGTIKKLVREYLETTGVCKFRPGRREEGGDGVTVIEL